MPISGQIKIASMWPTGVPMAFSLTAVNSPMTPTNVPEPGTKFAECSMFVPSEKMGDFADYELVTIRPTGEYGVQEWFFAAPLEGQQTYNYEFFNNAEYKWPRLKQTWLVKRSAVATVTSSVTAPPALGMTWTVFSNRLLRTTGFGADMFVLDSLYVIYEVEYEDATTALVSSEIDHLTGDTMSITTTRVANGTNGTAVAGSGSYSEIQNENSRWAIKITRYVTTLTSRTLNVVVNYSWPPILSRINLYPVVITQFPGVKYLVNPDYASGGYDGPCSAIIAESWSATNPTATSVTQMIPTPVRYDGIFMNISERSCLHGAFTFQETANNSNYVGNFTNTVTVAATSPTSWPATIVAKVDVEAYRGGFMKRVLTIYKPS